MRIIVRVRVKSMMRNTVKSTVVGILIIIIKGYS